MTDRERRIEALAQRIAGEAYEDYWEKPHFWNDLAKDYLTTSDEVLHELLGKMKALAQLLVKKMQESTNLGMAAMYRAEADGVEMCVETLSAALSPRREKK